MCRLRCSGVRRADLRRASVPPVGELPGQVPVQPRRPEEPAAAAGVRCPPGGVQSAPVHTSTCAPALRLHRQQHHPGRAKGEFDIKISPFYLYIIYFAKLAPSSRRCINIFTR